MGVPTFAPSATWNGFGPAGFVATYVDPGTDNGHYEITKPGTCGIDVRDRRSVQIAPSGDRAAVIEQYAPGGYGYVSVLDISGPTCDPLWRSPSIDFIDGQNVGPPPALRSPSGRRTRSRSVRRGRC